MSTSCHRISLFKGWLTAEGSVHFMEDPVLVCKGFHLNILLPKDSATKTLWKIITKGMACSKDMFIMSLYTIEYVLIMVTEMAIHPKVFFLKNRSYFSQDPKAISVINSCKCSVASYHPGLLLAYIMCQWQAGCSLFYMPTFLDPRPALRAAGATEK